MRGQMRRAETKEADTTLTLSQGDYFVLPPLVAGEIRNEGQEPVSIVIAAITPGLIPVSRDRYAGG